MKNIESRKKVNRRNSDGASPKEKMLGKLTIGLDLGDRTSRQCILNEQGEVISESSFGTTKKDIERVFGSMSRCRIALEVGTHSPW